ncbi:MAG: oxidoreductase [Marinilabiliales bacterium]|mgnify:CR=1 FL=1|nr:MAG: oxidoreductase [Marinilabiliales bacterium]
MPKTKNQKYEPVKFTGYDLIDFGNGKKLEQFGDIKLIRPETNAKGILPSLNIWEKYAHAEFIEKDNKSGYWKPFVPMNKNEWLVQIAAKRKIINIELQKTEFKHIGIFPEQIENWNKLYSFLNKHSKPKTLNLFAYTGIASLVASAAGSNVTHVEAIKKLNTWGKENMSRSDLSDIRWIHDDAVKFVSKEIRRGNKYQCIILDPPYFGRGPKGEIWKLEKDLEALLENINQLIDKKNGLIIASIYSGDYTPYELKKLFTKCFPKNISIRVMDLSLKTKNGKSLNAGFAVHSYF